MLAQVGIVVLGAGVLVGMLWEPHLEGRNVDSTLFEIYFKDPFLAFVYLGSVPFFVGLFQAFKLLGYARQDRMFSHAAVTALRTMKFCALITLSVIVTGGIVLVINARDAGDDPAGAVALGFIATLAAIVVATTAAALERVCKKPLINAATS